MLSNPIEAVALCALVQAAQNSPTSTFEKITELELSANDFLTPISAKIALKVIETLANGERFIPRFAKIDQEGTQLAIWAASIDLPSSNLVQSLEALKNESRRLKAVLLFQRLAKSLAQSQLTVDEAQQAIADSEAFSSGSEGIQSELEMMLDFQAYCASGKGKIIKTGLEGWDRALTGVRPNLTVVGAQPGSGKSGLLAGLADSFLGLGRRVGILSLEDPNMWLVRRLTAFKQQMSLTQTYQADEGTAFKARVDTATAAAARPQRPLFSKFSPKPTPPQLAALARQMIVGKKVDVLLIDHLGQIAVDTQKNHHLEIDKALSGIRAIATENSIPIILFAHTNRLADGEKPTLKDFAFSAGVERISRLALSIVRKESTRDIMEVHVLKNTEGVAGNMFTLNFHEESAMVIA